MTKKQEIQLLTTLFNLGISGASENAYAVLVSFMNKLPVEAKKLTFRLNTLKEVLTELSKKWDKEIDKVL